MGIQSLTREELLALLKRARAARTRDWLMILVAFWHGLRASEVIALTPDKLKDGFITVQRLKGSLKTTQPLMEHEDPLLNERAAISDFMHGMHRNQRLFPVRRETFWRIVQGYGNAIGLPSHKRNTKMLKHSFAMQFIQSIGIENVRQYLGHKSISSTGAYLKVSDSEAAASVKRALKG